MIEKFLLIIQDEIKRFLNDKGVILIMVIGVIAYSLCYAIPYYNEIVKEVPIAVVDLDQSNASSNFIQDLNTSDCLSVMFQSSSLEEVKDEFYKNNIKGYVIIPKDFEKKLFQGQQADISLYADSSYLIIYKSLYMGVLQTALDDGAKIEVARMMKAGVPQKRAQTIKQAFKYVDIPLFNSIGGYKSYVYSLILVLVLHQTFLIGLGLLQGTKNEKRQKYCDTNIPLTLFVRTTTYIMLYSLYAGVFFLIYPSVFVFPAYYNILPLAVIYLLMMYAAGFFLQTLSYFLRTRETSILVFVPFSIILIFILGIIWPRETMPQFINWISFLIPVTCGADGIVKLNQNGASFNNILYDYLWLLFLCITYFITAVKITEKLDKEFEQKNTTKS